MRGPIACDMAMPKREMASDRAIYQQLKLPCLFAICREPKNKEGTKSCLGEI
jgi:hypothetical protein